MELLFDELVIFTGESEFAFDTLLGSKALRFEQVISCLQVIDRKLKFLDYIRVRYNNKTRKPNAFHFFLANALSRGVDVLTTNFDALIEISCEHANIRPRGRFIKLHGTIEMIRDGRVIRAPTADLAATLRAVSSGNSQLTLSPFQKRLQDLVDGRNILILGYSCSDAFDIVPALYKSQPKSVIYCNYSNDEDLRVRFDIEGVSSRAACQLLRSWSDSGVPVRVIFGDIYPAINKAHDISDTGSLLFRKNAVSSLIKKAIKNSSRANLLLGLLLRAQDRYECARQIISNSLIGLRGRLRGEALFRRARVMPEWDEVRHEVLRALPMLHATDARIEALIVLMDADSNLGPFENVELTWRLINNVLYDVYGKRYVDTIDYGKALHGRALGSLYEGKLSEARRLFEKSLRTRVKYGGDVLDQASALGALCLCRIVSNCFSVHDVEWRELLLLTDNVDGQVTHRDSFLINAMLCINNGNYDEAIYFIEKIEGFLNDGTDQQIDPEVLCLKGVSLWLSERESEAARVFYEMHEHSKSHSFFWHEQLATLLLEGAYMKRVPKSRNRYFKWFLDRLVKRRSHPI